MFHRVFVEVVLEDIDFYCVFINPNTTCITLLCFIAFCISSTSRPSADQTLGPDQKSAHWHKLVNALGNINILGRNMKVYYVNVNIYVPSLSRATEKHRESIAFLRNSCITL